MKRALAAALLLLAVAAHAGRPCEETPLTTNQIERGMNLAQATAKQLDATQADVVLLARAGQDLSKYGLKWSHLGFAYRETSAEGKPVWRVLHKLNHCGTAQAELYRQGLGEFFLDRPFRYAASYVVLKPELQQALLPLLRDNARATALHEPRYNMLAYPFSPLYQQSNQWALETLAAAAEPGLRDRRAAQAWLRAKGYRGTDMRLSTFTRLGARMSMANVAFDDHPADQRYSGHIETTTVESLFAWLPRAGLSQDAVLIKHRGEHNNEP